MMGRSCQFTIIVDNQGAAALATEHGFSLWIEADGRRILFDTGQGAALPENARRLNVTLSDADALVLSHGHYDHTGAVAHVVSVSASLDVYCHPGVARPRYAIRDGAARAIHMPHGAMAAIDNLPSDRLHWASQPMRISEGIGLTGPIARETDFEDPGGPFFLDAEGRRPDAIDDDLALWVQTDAGLVVCVGCAHAGIVNTLRCIHQLTPGEKIRAIIGGFHLVNAGRRRLDETIAALASMDLERLVACHCTGEDAVKALAGAFGRRLSIGAAGLTYRF